MLTITCSNNQTGIRSGKTPSPETQEVEPPPGHPGGVPKPPWEDLPDRKMARRATDTEDTMGYILFLVIAFVLLGAERVVTRWHEYSARHEAPPSI
jgi:hypothetical protein